MRMLVSLALTFAAAPALAVPPAQQAGEAQQPAAKPVKEKKICKTVGEEEIGSRFGKERVCKTAAEWDKIDKQSRKHQH